MCFDVRTILGKKRAAKTSESVKEVQPHSQPSTTNSSSQTGEIPLKKQKLSSEIPPNYHQASVTSLKVFKRSSQNALHHQSPLDYDAQANYRFPVDISQRMYYPPNHPSFSTDTPVYTPPRTTSLKYDIHIGEAALPNSVWAAKKFTNPPTNQTSLTYSPKRAFQAHETKILSQWYRAHRDRPYPTPSEKKMLARQCGISALQVSRWFSDLRKSNRKSRNVDGYYLH